MFLEIVYISWRYSSGFLVFKYPKIKIQLLSISAKALLKALAPETLWAPSIITILFLSIILSTNLPLFKICALAGQEVNFRPLKHSFSLILIGLVDLS